MILFHKRKFIRSTQSFLKEVDEYLSLYPHTQHIDICLHDLNGHIRGKRIDVKSLKIYRMDVIFLFLFMP